MKEEFKWRTMNKGNVKGNQRLKHWANDYPRFWPKRGCQRLKQNNVSQNCLVHRRDSYARQSVPETMRETAVPRTAECEKGAADRAVYRSRRSDCRTDSRYSKAADESCVYQKGILVQKKSSVIGGRRNFPDENVCHRRQGYLPKLVTKMCEMPTTFESSVVK